MIVICFLALCLCPCFRAWTSPQTMMELSTLTVTFLDSYTDPVNNKIHALFHFVGHRDLIYIRYSNGRIESMHTFSNFGPIYTNAAIEGQKNSLFVAMIRNNTNITFYESETLGDSWKNPQVFYHNATCNLGSLVLMNDTGRLYLTYICDDDIFYIARPPTSEIFTKEQMITNNSMNNYVSSCYSMKNYKPIIHLAWTTKYLTVYYTNSENNGNTWKEPEELRIKIVDIGIKMFSNPGLSNSVFLFSFYGIRMVQVVYSNDNFNTFSKPAFIDDGMLGNNVVMCGTKQEKALITAFSHTYIQFVDWENNKLNVTSYANPFMTAPLNTITCDSLNLFEVTMLGPLEKDHDIVASAKRNWKDK